MIFNILDNTTELYMTKYIIGEIFSSGKATLYKNPSDQTVYGGSGLFWIYLEVDNFYHYSSWSLLMALDILLHHVWQLLIFVWIFLWLHCHTFLSMVSNHSTETIDSQL